LLAENSYQPERPTGLSFSVLFSHLVGETVWGCGAVRFNLKKMSLKQLQTLIQERGVECYPDVIAALEADPRGGAQRLVRLCRERLSAWERERGALSRMSELEQQVRAMGHARVAGVSEVGRGPLAGPVVAAAVILPADLFLPGLTEVRKLSPKRRVELAEAIRAEAIAFGLGIVQPDGLDEGSVIRAIYRAMVEAVMRLPLAPDYLLTDGLHLPEVKQSQTLVVGGESASVLIAAAQLLARVERDRYMTEMDRRYPEYGFAAHKGYGTAEHREALRRYGPCPLHRGATAFGHAAATSVSEGHR
jgi:ribonuclease HII